MTTPEDDNAGPGGPVGVRLRRIADVLLIIDARPHKFKIDGRRGGGRRAADTARRRRAGGRGAT